MKMLSKFNFNYNLNRRFFCIKIDNVKQLLNSIKFKGDNLSTLNIIHSIQSDNNKNIKVYVNLHKDHRDISKLIISEITKIQEYSNCDVNVELAPIGKKDAPKVDKGKYLSKIKYIIAVSSCKGGVGKSTVAVNLATSLKLLNKKVGIFDADIHGPSLPVLINTEQKQAYTHESDPNTIIPIMFEDIKLMSYGFAAPNKRAVVRGPIVSSIVSQLILNTNWGDLDYLIVDFPPGTGDIQLSLCQEVKFTGAVIVTTPQRLSFIDVVKGIEMFDEMKVPILAAVENMSYYKCDNCDVKHKLFGLGYLAMLKKQFGIENSFEIPLEKKISSSSDSGSPFSLAFKDLSTINNNNSLSVALNEFSLMARSIDASVSSNEFKSLINPPLVEFNNSTKVFEIKQDNKIIKKIGSKELRIKCICAACIDEFTGNKILKEDKIPIDIFPKKIEPKGNYAVSVVWSDGHRSSIYPYKRIISSDILSYTEPKI